MSAKIQYDISIIGLDKIKKMTKSIEGELAAHEKRLTNRLGGSSGTRGTATNRGRIQAGSLRGFDEIGKAAVAASKKEHQEKMRNIKAEERARIQAVRNEERERKRAEVTEQRRIQNVRQSRVNFARGVASNVGGSLKSGASIVAGGASALLGLGAISALQKGMEYTKQTAMLANAAFKEGGPSRKDLQRGFDTAFYKNFKETGTSKQDQAMILAKYGAVAGDYSSGMELMPYLLQVKDAFGANPEEIGGTFARFRNSVKGGTDLEKTEKAKRYFSILASLGEKGEIELKDAAGSYGGTVLAQAGKYEGDFEKNFQTIASIGTLTKATTGVSVSEVENALQAMGSDFTKNEKNFRAAGIDVFADKGRTQLRGADKIIMEAISKTGGDQVKLNKMFNLQSRKVLDPFMAVFRNAGGGAKGLEAMNAQMKEMEGMAEEKRMKESAEFAREQEGAKLGALKEEFDYTIYTEFMPVLMKALPQLAAAIPGIAKLFTKIAEFGNWTIENPYKGIGVIIGALIVKDLAAAGIGAAVKAALTGLIGGGSVGAGGILAVPAAVLAGSVVLTSWLETNAVDEGGRKWAKKTKWHDFLTQGSNILDFGTGGKFDAEKFNPAGTTARMLSETARVIYNSNKTVGSDIELKDKYKNSLWKSSKRGKRDPLLSSEAIENAANGDKDVGFSRSSWDPETGDFRPGAFGPNPFSEPETPVSEDPFEHIKTSAAALASQFDDLGNKIQTIQVDNPGTKPIGAR